MESIYTNIFDSHSHYDDSAFDSDRDMLIPKMLAENVVGIIHCATDEASCRYGIEYSEKYDNYYTSIGFHPENLSDLPENYLDILEALLQESDKIVAVGEIGLDYHYEGYDRQKQLEVFEAQVRFAIAHDLPVIVHSRDATEDTMEVLRRLRPEGVLHCFSGSYETAREVISLGMYIGFTGALTFKNAKKAVRACSAVPIDRLLLETDCPYMAPEGFRGKRSDSTMIYITAQKAAEILGLDTQAVLDATAQNARTLFLSRIKRA